MQVEREASMPVTLEDVPSGRRQRRVPAKFVDMVPTSLKGLPHLRLKPGLAVLPTRRQAAAPIVSSSTSASNVSSPHPSAAVVNALDDDMADIQPLPPTPAPSAAPVPAPTPPPQPVHPTIDTQPNRFGVFRRYTTAPRSDPEEGLTLDAFADASTHLRPPPDPRERDTFRPFGTTARAWFSDARDVAANSFAPFLNWTAFKLMEWQYSGSMTKSAGELQRLIDIVVDDRFKKEDLHGFNVEEQQHKLDSYRATGGAFSAKDGWREGSVRLPLPKVGVTHEDEEHAVSFDVDKIWYRPFVEVIKSAFTDATACKFHWFPHMLLRKRGTAERPDTPPERLYTDVYNSDAMIREHEELQRQPLNPEDPPDVERVIAAIGVYSDSTHLANFGTASLWPVYAYFLNLSKYVRLKPTTFAAHHLAYIPSVSTHCNNACSSDISCAQLPARLFQYYEECYGEPPSEAVMRLIKHDLVCQVWLLLLDDDFIKAYRYGLLILCADGILRRVFPRIFIYSADYPEKCVEVSDNSPEQSSNLSCIDALSRVSSVWVSTPVRIAPWIRRTFGRWG